MSAKAEIHQFSRVDFTRFKAFKKFGVSLNRFNILVGPNNAGKSTVLAAFRILAAAMRTAHARKATLIQGHQGMIQGHKVDLSAISVGEENIFYNYDDSEYAEVIFHISNGNSLRLHFPESGVCILIPDAQGRPIVSPSSFKREFNCLIGFVPILGPVEHNERLYEKEAARQALFNYRAARNFRNIWHHYPEHFAEFRSLLQQTWPGMDIEPPEIDKSHDKPLLFMFCPEQRIPRELFWSGFGFQVWCQMLTHLIQSRSASLFLIDEPDIYLHSDLQRQLLAILRNLGPDVLVATHSTEMIAEADTDEIILIDKNRQSGRRLHNPSQLVDVFEALGSNTNPTLTQIAKTKRVLFVEGKDFQILGRFARKLGKSRVGNRQDFAVAVVEGFNPDRIRSLKSGMEETLGAKIVTAAILDRDYRYDAECAAITKQCEKFCDYVRVLKRKEIENFLLHPDAIDRAIQRKLDDQQTRTGVSRSHKFKIIDILSDFVKSKKTYIASQILAGCRQFSRGISPSIDETTANEQTLNSIEKLWEDYDARLRLVGGKEAISYVNKYVQRKYGVNVTQASIIDAMRNDEISNEMKELVELLAEFSTTPV